MNLELRLHGAVIQGLALAAAAGCGGVAQDSHQDRKGEGEETPVLTSGDGDGDESVGDGDGDESVGDGDESVGDGDESVGDGDGDGDDRVMVVEGPTPESLPALPEASCGESYGNGGGYYDSCCSHYSCREAESGVCPELEEIEVYDLPGYPPGSGSCDCDAAQGPFSNPESFPAYGDGPCCYVIWAIGCEGRPLRAEQNVHDLGSVPCLLAPVVARGDWC